MPFVDVPGSAVAQTFSQQLIFSRPTWQRHLDFIITCAGNTVGLGNIWRFPHLCYKNGGGAFLIPYILSLVLVGTPLFFLEISFGQFAGLGTIASWEINPMFKGFGISMTIVAAIISIYYNVIIATCFYFLFATMQESLPWGSCGHEWNTCLCREPGMKHNLDIPLYHVKNGMNCTGWNISYGKIRSPSEEYYYRNVLDITENISVAGGLKWDITLCNLLCWCIVFASLIGSVRTLGKVAYVSTLFPYFIMTVLLLKGFTLPGSWKGVQYYMDVHFDKLGVASAWKDAAAQVIFSCSCCQGTLIALSSFNKFHANCIRDGLVLTWLNAATSFYVGFTVFSTIGYLAWTTGKDVENIETLGPSLLFIAYPAALAHMSTPHMWSVLFFGMVILLGFGTQFGLVETVITALQDECLLFRKNGFYFRMLVCFMGFLLGLPQTTHGGIYILSLLNHFIDFPLLMIGFLESIIMIWIYSPKKFAEDMTMMLGYSRLNKLIFHAYFLPTLMFSTPCLVGVILISTLVTAKQYEGPDWAVTLGWLMVIFIMIWTLLWYISGQIFWSGNLSHEQISSNIGLGVLMQKGSKGSKNDTGTGEADTAGQDYTAAGSDGIRISINKMNQKTSIRWAGQLEGNCEQSLDSELQLGLEYKSTWV